MPEDKPITTLDEAIEKLYPLDDPRKNMFHDNPVQYIRREAFKNGAEWQSQQKETKPTGLRKLIDIRNKFYHNLPTRDIKSWDLLQHIKSHLKDIDNYINQHTTTSEETEETKPVEDKEIEVMAKNHFPDDVYAGNIGGATLRAVYAEVFKIGLNYQTPKPVSEEGELKKVLRELTMRSQILFPENELDLKQFDEGIKGQIKLFDKISNLLKLGKP